jgi:hypothetical protein
MKTTETEKAEVPVTDSVEEAVRERLETIEQDKKTASPWPEVKRRILERHPQP